MDLVKDFWSQILAIISFGYWLVRLEGRMNANAKDVTRLEKQMDSDRADARASRAETNDILREVQRDIKLLLGWGHKIHWNDKTQPPR